MELLILADIVQIIIEQVFSSLYKVLNINEALLCKQTRC